MASTVRDSMLEYAADLGAMVPYWDLSDTLVDGITAMRLAGQTYLPKFPAEEKDAYEFRLKSTTMMTNIFADIIESLSSKPFEQAATLLGDDVPQELMDFIDNVDGAGNNLTVFGSGVFYDSVKSGIDWIFVDFPPADPTVRNLADAKARGARPYWTKVLGRNVREVKSEYINGKMVLTYIRIFEPGKPDHVRVIERQPDGKITWALYVKTDTFNDEKQTAFVVESAGAMTIDEIPMVPFMTGRKDTGFKFDPPLRAAADLQEHLYRLESGFNYITTLTAYPMLTGNGVKPERDAAGNIKPLAVGPSTVLYAPPNADGSVGSWRYIEPASNSLQIMMNTIDKVISNLRELGRQPLTASSSNLTVVTTAFAAGKSKSSVKAWAHLLQDALENAMRITAKWMNVDYTAKVFVYTEFDEFVDGKDYDALAADRDRGDISQETYWEERKRRGLYSNEFTAERERERLLTEVPGDTGADTTNIDGINNP